MSLHTIHSYRDTVLLLPQYTAKDTRRKIEVLTLVDFTADRVTRFLRHLETERHNRIATRNARLALSQVFPETLAEGALFFDLHSSPERTGCTRNWPQQLIALDSRSHRPPQNQSALWLLAKAARPATSPSRQNSHSTKTHFTTDRDSFRGKKVCG